MSKNKIIIKILWIKQRLIAYDVLYEKFLQTMDDILINFKFTFLVTEITHIKAKLKNPTTNINI